MSPFPLRRTNASLCEMPIGDNSLMAASCAIYFPLPRFIETRGLSLGIPALMSLWRIISEEHLKSFAIPPALLPSRYSRTHSSGITSCRDIAAMCSGDIIFPFSESPILRFVSSDSFTPKRGWFSGFFSLIFADFLISSRASSLTVLARIFARKDSVWCAARFANRHTSLNGWLPSEKFKQFSPRNFFVCLITWVSTSAAWSIKQSAIISRRNLLPFLDSAFFQWRILPFTGCAQ